jgi:GrpB-like predicted nucleotidyltransferase (UPF0157 family)
MAGPDYVKPRERHDGPIFLAAYDPEWTTTYEDLAETIRKTLGDIAVEVEHVGSTAVPGLDAKPIIDIDLIVPDSTDEASYVGPLERLGYEFILREPDWFEHRLLRLGVPAANLHVFSEGCEEHTRMLEFRDRMRVDDDVRDRYRNAKRALSSRTWAYIQDYADAKSDIIREILHEL